MDPVQKKSVGPLIGTIIIIVLLIIGGFYFWGEKLSTKDESAPVSGSDEVSSIEKDLKVSNGTEVDFSSLE